MTLALVLTGFVAAILVVWVLHRIPLLTVLAWLAALGYSAADHPAAALVLFGLGLARAAWWWHPNPRAALHYRFGRQR